MRTLRLGTVLLALVLVVAACGGDDDDTATTAAGDAAATEAPADDTAAPDTTAPADDGEDDRETVTVDQMPQECYDAFVEYLRALEPSVTGIDFESATLTDLETIMTDLEPVFTEMEAGLEELDCPDLDSEDEATREEVLAIAEREAPGTVAFLEFSLGLAESFGGGGDVGAGSGDCETDIAAVQEMVDAGGTINDLTLAQLGEIGALMTSIQTNCTLDRFTEWASDPDVSAFLGG